MGLFRPVVSGLTTVEINPVPDFVQSKYGELLDLEHVMLEVGDEVLYLLFEEDAENRSQRDQTR